MVEDNQTEVNEEKKRIKRKPQIKQTKRQLGKKSLKVKQRE
jgi:hypothetical protein